MHFYSHIGQDRWVAETLKYRRDAFFLEFGAFDGLTSSNTATLERELGWNGIVVEANPTYYPLVCQSRMCITINAALWSVSRQSLEMIDAHGLSAMVDYINVDNNGRTREEISRGRFFVDSLNPTELLRRFKVPDRIEYLSLDVEGCELDVLRAIDFSYYQIAMMTIEHSDDDERRQSIRNFVLPLGYQVLQRHYDDWFYHPRYLAQLQLPGEYFDAVSAFQIVEKEFDIPY